MKQTINFYDFQSAFEEQRPDNFSYDALAGLFVYFEEMEGCGLEIELDVVAICCDYCESTLGEFNQDYSQEFETLQDASDYIQENGSLVSILSDSLVYAYL